MPRRSDVRNSVAELELNLLVNPPFRVSKGFPEREWTGLSNDQNVVASRLSEKTPAPRFSGALRRMILLASLSFVLLAVGCAGARREAKHPEREPEGIEVRCPNCKTIFRW